MMILLPVIERELRATARSRRTYRNRFLAALAIVSVLLWALYSHRGAQENVIGSEIFDYVTILALIVALLAGFFHTADSISEERREGTLGLLYLTDLRSLHVVIGKLVAHSIPACFALATIIPVLGIPFLLGGITPGELQRVALILINALWLSLVAGVFASTLVKDDRGALLITFVLVALPTMIAPIFQQQVMSAFWTLSVARDRAYVNNKDDFLVAIVVQFALPFLYLSLAAWRARNVWRERPATVAGEKRRAVWRALSGGTSEQRKEWRGEMLLENPALWLACRRRARTALLWAVLGIGGIWLTWLWFADRRIDPVLGMLASIVFHWILKITIAFAACRALSDEARSGAFELLFTTHLTPTDLVRGHLFGLIRSFGVGIAVVVVWDILWIAFGRMENFFSSDFPTTLWLRIAFLLSDLATIAVYGLWLGYKLQRSGRAAMRVLLFVVVLPNVAWAFLLAGQDALGVMFLSWFIIDAALIGIGLRNLRSLRERASERFAANSAPG